MADPNSDRCLLCRGRGEMSPHVAGGPSSCNNCGARRVKGLWTWRDEFAPKACMHGIERPTQCPSCETAIVYDFPPAKAERINRC